MTTVSFSSCATSWAFAHSAYAAAAASAVNRCINAGIKPSLLLSCPYLNALDPHGTWPAVLHDERREGAARRLARLHAFHRPQIDLHALRRDVYPRVAAVAALGKKHVGIGRAPLFEPILRAVLRADRRADEFARHDRRAGVVEVGFELAHIERVHI